MVYREGKRFYIINGQEMPSVNTVLNVIPESPRLTAWKNRTENWYEIQEYRKLQGHVIHYQVACYVASQINLPPPELPMHGEQNRLLQKIFRDKKKRESFNREVKLAVAMFKDWDLEYTPEYLDTEIVVHSKIEKFAGTVDLYCIIKKEYWIIDLKSNPYIFEKYENQLGGYWIAMHEMGKPCDKIGLLNISPTLRTQYGYKFTQLGNFSRDFLKVRRKFTRLHGI